MTLDEAKAHARAHREKGTRCLCCDRVLKIYRWKFNDSMALSLIHLYQFFRDHPNETWCHAPTYLREKKVKSAGDGMVAILRHWGLVEECRGTTAAGNKKGLWRITEQGVAFVEGDTMVPRAARIFLNELVDFSEGDLITIQDALGYSFNYRDMAHHR